MDDRELGPLELFDPLALQPLALGRSFQGVTADALAATSSSDGALADAGARLTELAADTNDGIDEALGGALDDGLVVPGGDVSDELGGHVERGDNVDTLRQEVDSTLPPVDTPIDFDIGDAPIPPGPVVGRPPTDEEKNPPAPVYDS